MSTTEVQLSEAERIERLIRDGLGLLNIREAAAFLGPGFLPRWVDDATRRESDPIPSFMLLGKKVVKTVELDAWVELLRAKGSLK